LDESASLGAKKIERSLRTVAVGNPNRSIAPGCLWATKKRKKSRPNAVEQNLYKKIGTMYRSGSNHVGRIQRQSRIVRPRDSGKKVAGFYTLRSEERYSIVNEAANLRGSPPGLGPGTRTSLRIKSGSSMYGPVLTSSRRLTQVFTSRPIAGVSRVGGHQILHSVILTVGNRLCRV